MKKQNEEITVKGLLDLFLPKLWIILVVSVILSLLVGGYSKFLKKDTYTSDVEFFVVGATTSIPTSVGYDGVNALIGDYIYLLKTRTFYELVANKMLETYGEVSISQIRSSVSMVKNAEASAFHVNVTSESPEFSKATADAIALLACDFINEYIDYNVKINVTVPPLLAETPDSKNVVRNAIIGFAAGAILTMLAIFVASRFDVVVRSKEVLEKNYDIPILGTIPRLEYDTSASAAEGPRRSEYHPTKKTVVTQSAPAQHPNVVDGRVVFNKSEK